MAHVLNSYHLLALIVPTLWITCYCKKSFHLKLELDLSF